jgi:hypothetical protein
MGGRKTSRDPKIPNQHHPKVGRGQQSKENLFVEMSSLSVDDVDVVDDVNSGTIIVSPTFPYSRAQTPQHDHLNRAEVTGVTGGGSSGKLDPIKFWYDESRTSDRLYFSTALSRSPFDEY